jgi:hypothetical protein
VRLTRRIATLSWIALTCLGACADLLDIAENPVLVPPDPFTCTKDDARPPPPPMPDKAVVRVHACDFISSNCSTPVKGLTAKLCEKKDFPCENPKLADLKDTDGDLTFEVPTGGSLGAGFDGYLSVNGPVELCTNKMSVTGADACALVPKCDAAKKAAKDNDCLIPTYIPALLFFNPPITADSVAPMVLPLIPSIAGMNLLAGGGGPTVETSQGVVFATGLDCTGRPAAGLTFNSSPASKSIVYVDNGLISFSTTETDGTGVSGLLGIPFGFAWVSVRSNGPMGPTELAKIGVQILPSTVSYVALAPAHN